jgi:hypothetical protein
LEIVGACSITFEVAAAAVAVAATGLFTVVVADEEGCLAVADAED